MTKFNELMTMNSTAPAEVSFKQVHGEIIACGQMASNYIYELGRKLKQMRDEKLFTVAGFNNFGEYTKEAIGFTERQAYTYISIFENNTTEFLKLTSKIGVTKLALISTLPEDQKTEIVKNDVENITVKELKAKIAELEGSNEKLANQIDTLTTDEIETQNKIDEAVAEANARSKERLEALTAEGMRLKNERTKATADLEKAKADLAKAEADIQKIKAEPPKTVAVEDVSTKQKLADAEKAQSALEAEIEQLNKKLATSAPEILAFKIKFENWQNVSAELIDSLSSFDVEKKEKFTTAIKAVIERWSL